MPKLIKLLSFAAFALVIAAGPAFATDTTAKQAILIDLETGSVLMEKNAHDRMPTASMSKVMTMYMVFEAIKEGRISLEDELLVSEKAWRKGGSKMFVEVNKRVKVEDLIRGVVIQSGNDATIVLAEGISGSEIAFAEEMTDRAHEMGMKGSNFVNASGWPHPDHYSTAHDLAILAQHLIKDFPEYYHYYAEKEFTYNGIRQANRNPLLYRGIGADGIKTGHTEEAGYGLIGSAENNERRLVMVINGLNSDSARAREGERLLSWGFRNFDTVEFFNKGDTVGDALIWLGKNASVPIVIDQDINMTMSRSDRRKMKVSYKIQEPIPAPVQKGQVIGTLTIEAPNMGKKEYPLKAGNSSAKHGFAGRIKSALHFLLFGSA